MPLPYLTQFAGIGGTIKNRPEDFFVQEVPLYEPSGDGEHVYCEVQKVGLTTFETIDRLGRALKVPGRDIGYAGLKDARAVTRQLLTIPRVTEDAVMTAVVPDVQVLWAARHGNKLRMGHLAGNRFAVKVRDVTPTDVVKLEPVLTEIEKRGMPNYFGEQRFGRRGDNDRLGAALVRGDDLGLLKLLLGSPDPAVDDEPSRRARDLFDAGDLQQALNVMPRRFAMEARVLARYVKTGDAAAALSAADDRVRKLWVSALQSRMFNDVVAKRIAGLDRLLDGDLAWKHDSGAVFAVESAAAEQPRCDAFEVSPSGPLVGYRMSQPTGEPARIEEEAFAAEGLKPEDFRRTDGLKVKGVRRPLRVKPTDIALEAGADNFGPYITVVFSLPPGSFATVLMRELMRTDGATAAGPFEGNERSGDPSVAGDEIGS